MNKYRVTRFFMVDGVYTWECKRNWDWEADCQSFTPTVNFFTHKLIEVQNGIRFLWKMPVGPSYLIWSRPYLEETIRWIIQTVKSSGLRTLAFFNVFYNFWQIFQPICHFVSEVTVHKKRCLTDLRQHVFSDRIVNKWNSLSEDIVSASSLNNFKGKLQRSHNDRSSTGFF